MLLGHYALAFAARRAEPRVPLGTTTLAAQLLDLLWPIFLLLGLERVAIVPNFMRMNPLQFLHYPWSHSLLAAVAWAAIGGAIYYAVRRYKRGAWLVALLVVSHWFLDLPMHRPDLPLWPGDSPHFGLGLWNSFAATVAVELGLFTIGVALYVHGTCPRDAVGTWSLAGLVAFLLLIFLGGLTGEAPPSPRAVAFVTLGLWLFVPWGYWVERHRRPRVASDQGSAAEPSVRPESSVSSSESG